MRIEQSWIADTVWNLSLFYRRMSFSQPPPLRPLGQKYCCRLFNSTFCQWDQLRFSLYQQIHVQNGIVGQCNRSHFITMERCKTILVIQMSGGGPTEKTQAYAPMTKRLNCLNSWPYGCFWLCRTKKCVLRLWRSADQQRPRFPLREQPLPGS